MEVSPPFHHASLGVVERLKQTLLHQIRKMWLEEGSNFGLVVRRAVHLYNRTPLSRMFGTPIDLWEARRETWGRLIEHALLQREKANH